MEITVNRGVPARAERSRRAALCLRTLGVRAERVAIERNLEIFTRGANWGATQVASGDPLRNRALGGRRRLKHRYRGRAATLLLAIQLFNL